VDAAGVGVVEAQGKGADLKFGSHFFQRPEKNTYTNPFTY
jgi:hypothetical protein